MSRCSETSLTTHQHVFYNGAGNKMEIHCWKCLLGKRNGVNIEKMPFLALRVDINKLLFIPFFCFIYVFKQRIVRGYPYVSSQAEYTNILSESQTLFFLCLLGSFFCLGEFLKNSP